jgi:hypothetical protein
VCNLHKVIRRSRITDHLVQFRGFAGGLRLGRTGGLDCEHRGHQQDRKSNPEADKVALNDLRTS